MRKHFNFSGSRFLLCLTLGLTAATSFAKPAPAPTLSGSWQVTKLTGEPTPDNQSRLDFDPATHQYHAYFGCNHFNGQYTIKRQKLTLQKPVGTMMMCDNIEDERTGMGTLEFVRQWQITRSAEGLQLKLLDKSKKVRVEAIAVPEQKPQQK